MVVVGFADICDGSGFLNVFGETPYSVFLK